MILCYQLRNNSRCPESHNVRRRVANTSNVDKTFHQVCGSYDVLEAMIERIFILLHNKCRQSRLHVVAYIKVADIIEMK